MRRLLLFSLFYWISNTVTGQVPEGKYILNDTDESSVEIWFRKDYQFSYRSSYPHGGEQGQGKYEVKNRKLTLIFEDTDSLPSQPQTIFREGKDSVIIDVHFYDANDASAMPNVTLAYNDGRMGTASDNKGNAHLKIANPQLPLQIQISFVGTTNRKLTISKKGSYFIYYPMYFSNHRPVENAKTMEFRFKTNKDGDLLLQPKGHAGKSYWVYKRKEEQ
jgi:hypothetical protein